MERASYVPADSSDLRFIDPIARGKKILFIGESPHYEQSISAAVQDLSLHLRKDLNYTVLANECLYSLWPYWEARSLGSEAKLPNVIPESARVGDPKPWCGQVLAYNQTAAPDKKLLCTALDLDHAIGHTKPQTILYLGYLASKSSSSQAAANLAEAIPALAGLKSRKEIHAYLDDLERRFRAAWGSFSAADQEEITFSLALERASIDYQSLSMWGAYWKYHIRGDYFKKTIERSLAKAQSTGGGLICYVGGAHAELNPPVHAGGEARYFSREYAATRGQVASILVEKLSRAGGAMGELRWTALEQAALARMADGDRIFVDLRDESWFSLKHRPGKFFPKGGPKYDGVLFIK